MLNKIKVRYRALLYVPSVTHDKIKWEMHVAVGRFLQGRQRTQLQISEPRSRVKLFTTIMYLVL